MQGQHSLSLEIRDKCGKGQQKVEGKYVIWRYVELEGATKSLH